MPEPFWSYSPWITAPTFQAYRQGRWLVAALQGPHRVLTTSALTGGLTTALTHLVNHQSCEGSGHAERYAVLHRTGPADYHREVCAELTLGPETTAVMGTAANMMYASHSACVYEHLQVDAIVTAGVEGNAACAGDPASWMEGPSGWNKLPPVAGTINTIVCCNQPLLPEAHLRAVMTVTEAKTAALGELGIASRYSQDLATGTGTDQLCLCAPLREGEYAYSSTSPHSKLGELLGQAVRTATTEALRWQNGLEPSWTRSLVHALRRFGFSEQAFSHAMRSRLSEADQQLLEKNQNAVLYEPQTAAAAYAFASVWDRLRYGVLPPQAGREILCQQAATLASALAGQTGRWLEFFQRLRVTDSEPLELVYDALALGWAAKWDGKS